MEGNQLLLFNSITLLQWDWWCMYFKTRHGHLQNAYNPDLQFEIKSSPFLSLPSAISTRLKIYSRALLANWSRFFGHMGIQEGDSALSYFCKQEDIPTVKVHCWILALVLDTVKNKPLCLILNFVSTFKLPSKSAAMSPENPKQHLLLNI